MISSYAIGPGFVPHPSDQGHAQYWRGFKLHTDMADGQIQITAILAGANVSDVNVAICRNVKNWHTGDHRQRWLGSALVYANRL